MESRVPRSFGVIIPYYKDRETIRGCVKGFLQQTHKPAEILVVDDGSNDDVRALMAGLPVRVIECPHRGVSAARNTGIRQLNTDLVAFGEADGYHSPNFLEGARQALADPDVAGVNVALRRHWLREDLGDLRLLAEFQNLRWQAINVLTQSGKRPVRGAWAFRRADILAIGGFDESLEVGEDRELLHRLLAQSGGRLVVAGGTELWHREPATLRDFIGFAWSRAQRSITYRVMTGEVHLNPARGLAILASVLVGRWVTRRPALILVSLPFLPVLALLAVGERRRITLELLRQAGPDRRLAFAALCYIEILVTLTGLAASPVRYLLALIRR